jgi:SAM-dependent methyltransferase
MNQHFINYSKYYDLLYDDKDYVIEIDYINSLILSLNKGTKTILELGSGTGRHGLILQELGYDCQGIELSCEMANIAKSKGYNCYQGNICDFKFERKFDVALSLFHVISYLSDNNSLLSSFHNVNKHLNDGAYFIFDVWYGPAVLNLKPEPRIKKIEGKDFNIIRFAQPIIRSQENIVDVNYEIFILSKEQKVLSNFNECHPMRYFTIPEIELLANQTGFELLKHEEFLSGAKSSEITWGVCFILKKIN